MGRRKVRMGADEEQAQDVVAVIPMIEPLGRRALLVLALWDPVFLGQRLMPRPPADVIERRVPPDEDQPSGRIARRAVLRPGLEGTERSLLVSILSHVEIAEIAQQRRNHLRPGRCQACVDSALAHVARLLRKPVVARLPGAKVSSGLIS